MKNEDVLEKLKEKVLEYEKVFRNIILFCENPDNRHRLSDVAMCKFLDSLREQTIKLLKEYE